MRRYGVVKALLLFFILGVCFASFPSYLAAQKVISLNYSNFFPAPHRHSILAEQ